MRRLSSNAFGLLAPAISGLVCFTMMLMAATSKTPTALSTCTFAGNSVVTGSCGSIFNQTPAMTLRPADSVVGGVWRSGSSPSTVWFGDMTDQGYPNAPIQLQIYGADSGIFQTVYGWFPVTQYRTTPSGITFEMDAVHEVSPNALDAQIIHRAAEILSSPAVWNRSDNRKCPPNATTWSIFCAGVRAIEELEEGTASIIADRRWRSFGASSKTVVKGVATTTPSWVTTTIPQRPSLTCKACSAKHCGGCPTRLG
jgi:hypothetical protein